MDDVARPSLITVEEAAQVLGVGRKTTMYRVIKGERLMVVRIGRCTRVVRSDVGDNIDGLRREALRRRDAARQRL